MKTKMVLSILIALSFIPIVLASTCVNGVFPCNPAVQFQNPIPLQSSSGNCTCSTINSTQLNQTYVPYKNATQSFDLGAQNFITHGTVTIGNNLIYWYDSSHQLITTYNPGTSQLNIPIQVHSSSISSDGDITTNTGVNILGTKGLTINDLSSGWNIFQDSTYGNLIFYSPDSYLIDFTDGNGYGMVDQSGGFYGQSFSIGNNGNNIIKEDVSNYHLDLIPYQAFDFHNDWSGATNNVVFNMIGATHSGTMAWNDASSQFTFNNTVNVTGNETISGLIKLSSANLPACNSGTNGSSGRNNTGLYYCNNSGSWSKLNDVSSSGSSGIIDYTNIPLTNQSNNYSSNLVQNFSNNNISTTGYGEFKSIGVWTPANSYSSTVDSGITVGGLSANKINMTKTFRGLQSALYLQPSVNNLNAYGYYSAVTTYGAYNVSSLVGMYGYTPVLSSASYTGTITNVMGAEVNAGTFPIGGDGKVNNTYGLYIQRVGGGIVSNWAIYDNTTSPSLLYSLNTTNTITTQNASSYANSVVCYLAGGTLGHCTSIVGVSGTCTCVGN